MIDKNKLKELPENPGVYIMKDVEGNIIYVGKARNLKNRVNQYFQNSEKTIKVATLVSNIKDFEYIVTDTEMEALILECNLIKENMPRYNIMLKDDKSYPFIKLTINERFPRLLMTREVKKDGAKYFGPFTNASFVKQTIDFFNKHYGLKTCSKNFSKGKMERPCLNYHIEQCVGVCMEKVSPEEYGESILEILNILNGKHENVIKRLREEMKIAADGLDYERAAQLRDRIKGIIHISEKQKIVSGTLDNQDIIAFYKEDSLYCIQVFFIREGKVLGREYFFFPEMHNDKDFLNQFIKQFYHKVSFIPKELLIQTDIEDTEIIEKWLSLKKGSKVSIKIPQRGSKKKLLDMVIDNAKIALHEHKKKMTVSMEKQKMSYAWLMEKLHLTKKPFRIEAYDISNTGGVDSVGSMVVYEELKPNKKAYRRFKIKSITGQNDYGSMQEIVFRRIERGIKELNEGKKGGFLPIPDIILLDGGLGHTNAVKGILEHYNQFDICLCGLVKDDKHKLKGLIFEGQMIDIPVSTPIYYLLNNISDEVHRFAISFHKKLRSDTLISSELDNIKGIGAAKRKALLASFKSIDSIKKATVEELTLVAGINEKIARSIIEYFS